MVFVAIFGLLNEGRRIVKGLLRFLKSLKLSYGNLAISVIGLSVVTIVLEKLSAYFYFYYTSLNTVVIAGMGLSENTRIERWILAINEGINNPFTGSRFLGIWSMNSNVGSLHSGYLDVLYKVGLIGFIVYMSVLITCLLKLNRQKNHVSEATLISIMVYMMFYEVNLWPIGLCLIGLVMAISNKDKSKITVRI